jgi:ABC-type multidrug transport system fused ATPase/permease subunit
MIDLLNKLKRLYRLLGRHRKAAIVTCLLTVVAAVLESFGISMIMPIMQVIIEGSLQGRVADFLNPIVAQLPPRYLLPSLCIMFLVFLVLKFIFSMIRIFVSKRFVWQIRLEWLNRIYEKYLYSEYSYLLNNKQGVLLHNLIDETHRGAICLAQLTEYIAKLILLAALYVPLLLINWQATLILSLVIGSLLAATHTISKRYARTTGQKRLKFRQQLSGWGVEGISGARQIKIFGLEDWFLEKFSVISRNLYHVELRFEIIKVLPSYLSELVLGFLLVAVILYVSFFSDIQLNTLLPAIGVYLVVGQKMFNNIAILAGLRLQIIALLPSLSLAHSLSEEAILQEVLDKGDKIEGLIQDLEFKNIAFSYDRKKPVLSNLNMIITYGKMTAIIGQSGAGKSTIADLLLGIHRPQAGEVLVNGKNLFLWQLKSWRNRIGYVSQEPYLFNMTIRDNIAITCPNLSEEAIIDAAKKAFAHDFILELPAGYDTVVGDRGLKLSGGQRQRIAIARALVRKPDFFIFDEATSALDKESERMVQKAIAEIATEKTIMVIAHRFSTIERADTVYDLDKAQSI